MPKSRQIILISFTVLALFFTPGDADGPVLLQAFNWGAATSGKPSWYNVIKSLVDDAAAAGVTDVWFPPSSQSAAPEGYLPGALYDLSSSKYGSLEDLKSAIAAYKARSIRAVADIVINHRTGNRTDDKSYYCLFEGGTADSKMDWGEWAVVVNDKPYPCGTGKPDTGEDFQGAPDVDHSNPTIQSDIIEWMNWLKTEIGFQGWRIDMVKGYAPSILSHYVKSTSPAFAVGEFYDTDRGKVSNWIHAADDVATAFDFPTKYLLTDAAESEDFTKLSDNGSPAGLLGLLPDKSVTFVDNHDTARPGSKTFPYEKVMWGYAYIFTHPGVPTIFYDHFVDPNNRNKILELAKIRLRNKITPTSPVKIITAQQGFYMASANIEKVIMKIGSNENLGSFTPSLDVYNVSSNGKGWAVWEKK